MLEGFLLRKIMYRQMQATVTQQKAPFKLTVSLLFLMFSETSFVYLYRYTVKKISI